MPIVNVVGLQDVKPEALLTNSRYTVTCQRAQIIKREGGDQSLALNFTVKAGPTQAEGKSPEDRRLSDFFPLSGFEHMKDGGVYAKLKLRSACDAFGVDVAPNGDFDYEEFLLKDADIVTRNKDNRDTGVKETSIQSYVRKA